MSEKKAPERPRQVSMAGWMSVIGCSLILVTLFDAMSRVRSLEVREAVTEFLSEPPGTGLGITPDQAIEAIRILMFVAGGAAAAALVLAVFVLQRDNRARVGFTVAAALVLLTAPVSGFLALVVAFSAGVLWTKPARDWFAGREPVADGPSGGRGDRHEHDRPNPFRTHQPGDSSDHAAHRSSRDARQEHQQMTEQNPYDRPEPRPTQRFGDRDVQHSSAGQGEGQPQGQYPHGAPAEHGQQYSQPYGQGHPAQYSYSPQQGQHPDKRPTTVTIAAIVSWLFSGATALVFALSSVFALAGGSAFEEMLQEEIQAQPQLGDMFTASDLRTFVLVFSIIALVWSLAAFVLTILAFRRANWARITLVVSAAMSLLFSLASFPVGLLHTLASGAVIALLFTGGANPWFSRRGRDGQGGGYPGAGGWAGQGQQYPPQYGQPYPPYDPYGQQYGQYGPQQGQQYGGQYGPQYGYPGQPVPQGYGHPDPYAAQGQPPYGQTPPQPSYDQPQGQPSYDQPQGQSPYDQPSSGQQPQGQSPYDQPSSGQQPQRSDESGNREDADRDDPPKNVW